MTRSNMVEKAVKAVFSFLGSVTVLSVIVITVYLIVSGIPAIREIGFVNFLFGQKWASTASEPSYGILPFVLTSIYGTAGAVVVGVPVGFFSAVFLAYFSNEKVKKTMGLFIGVLSGIPSVVYGLVGMLTLVPAISKIFNLADGSSLFASIIVLSVMILPGVIKVSLDALEAVPIDYRDASLALGSTYEETVFRVLVPAARSGVLTSIVLGIGRAIGEAMAIMMVSGNVANMPKLFGSVRFLTTAVASELSYSSGLQRQALFSIALVLYFFILLINAALGVLKGGNDDK